MRYFKKWFVGANLRFRNSLAQELKLVYSGAMWKEKYSDTFILVHRYVVSVKLFKSFHR